MSPGDSRRSKRLPSRSGWWGAGLLVLWACALPARAQANDLAPVQGIDAVPSASGPAPAATPSEDTPPAPAELPPERAAPPERPASATAGARDASPLTELPRESAIENVLDHNVLDRSGHGASNAIGGYGELVYTNCGPHDARVACALDAPKSQRSTVDLRRLVLYFGHDFDEHFRFYSELEVEHAVTSDGFNGDVEFEQAYLDWLPSKRLNVRGGLLLMPMGIINIYHEPPSFFGVDRPDVDTYLIPTTWREPGLGIFGELAEGLRYQVYFVDGFNANNFSAQFGIRNGSQEGSLAYAGDFGVIGRLDYEPLLGTVLGVSAYGGTSGNTLTATVSKVGVGLFDVDARSRFAGFTARLECAALVVGDAGALDAVLGANGPVAKLSWGGYAELGYDLFHLLLRTSVQELSVFARFDGVDTQADMPRGYAPSLFDRRYSGIGGLAYKPIPQIALKADYRRQQLGTGEGYDQFDAAITWLF